MKAIRDYTNLPDVLIDIKTQVKESLIFAAKNVPFFTNPSDLFYWLKGNITYRADPNKVELLMTMQTFFSGVRTGTPGAGDCDDFTITALACLLALGFDDVFIVLVGYNEETPVHIYPAVNDNGLKWFDLTNNFYNQQRKQGSRGKYNYQQILEFQI